jgi:hypothetical protein
VTKQLSPAAQAMDFALYGPGLAATRRQIAAAALRTAADIVDDREASRQLHAIAYELEAQ